MSSFARRYGGDIPVLRVANTTQLATNSYQTHSRFAFLQLPNNQNVFTNFPSSIPGVPVSIYLFDYTYTVSSGSAGVEAGIGAVARVFDFWGDDGNEKENH